MSGHDDECIYVWWDFLMLRKKRGVVCLEVSNEHLDIQNVLGNEF